MLLVSSALFEDRTPVVGLLSFTHKPLSCVLDFLKFV